MKFKIMLFFLFLPVLSNANEIEIMFDCQNNSIKHDYYETESICHFVPLSDVPVLILNEKTNTEVNKEMLFALTGNNYIKKGFNTEALISEDFGYVKLNKKDVEKFSDVFGDTALAKKFITYHELGHIYFNNASEYTLKREMFSDLFALRMLGSEGFDLNAIKIPLMKYRKREAIEKEVLTHFTTYFIESYKEENSKCVSNELSCVINDSKVLVENFSKQDVFKERLMSNIRSSNGKWFFNYLFLTEYIYNKKFSYDFSKEDLIKEIKSYPEISLNFMLEDKQLKDYYLRMLTDEVEHSLSVVRENLQ